MSLKEYRHNTRNFWGLVEQKGPWKTTSSDIARSKRGGITIGGGIPGGGTEHAGHAGWFQSTDPKDNFSVLPPYPGPSRYAQPSIKVKSQNYAKKPMPGRIYSNTPFDNQRARGDRGENHNKAGSSTSSNFYLGAQGYDEGPESPGSPNSVISRERMPSLASESDFGTPTSSEAEVYKLANEYKEFNGGSFRIAPEHLEMAAEHYLNEISGHSYLNLKDDLSVVQKEIGVEDYITDHDVEMKKQTDPLTNDENNFLHLEPKVRK